MTGTAWFKLGAIVGGVGVIAGAFGAHGLKPYMDARAQDVFETAVRYQMYHALALLAVGLLGLSGRKRTSLSVAGWSFLLGILMFSGSLYGHALSGIRELGIFTPPIGGLAFIVGWVALAFAVPSTPKVTGGEF